MIWIDVTEIKNWQGHHTGIQRVIDKLGAEILRQEKGFSTCYFDYSTNTFRKIEYIFGNEVRYSTEPPVGVSKMRNSYRTLLARVKGGVSLRTKNRIKLITKYLSISNIKDEAVPFASGDTLFIPGAFWIYPIDTLNTLKSSQRIHIAGILYDLVPLVVPQFTAEVTISGYGDRFIDALRTFTVWFSISENTKNDAIKEAQKREINFDGSNIHVIKLGVDVMARDAPESKPGDFDISAGGFSLFVSTLEARKNQVLVYLAIKRLQESGRKHKPIVLVGKHGWLSDDIVYILKNDSTIKNKLLWLDRVDDRTLKWLYMNCSFTIYPSFYEGWGLPVAESLGMGKPCIASNSSSIPEIAGNLVEYFSPYSVDELAELIIRYDDNEYVERQSQKITDFRLSTWEACATKVNEILMRL